MDYDQLSQTETELLTLMAKKLRAQCGVWQTETPRPLLRDFARCSSKCMHFEANLLQRIMVQHVPAIKEKCWFHHHRIEFVVRIFFEFIPFGENDNCVC